MGKDSYYFSHDSNARNDPKILAMRSKYGIAGYGVFWVIIEMLREEENYKLPHKEYIFDAIAMQVQCKGYARDDAKQFALDCINEYELLHSDGQFFWSNSLIKRMKKRADLSNKRSNAAKTRWEKSIDTKDSDTSKKKQSSSNANAMQSNALAMQTDAIKGKEIKEKYIKDIKNIYSHWNSKNIIVHKELNKTRESRINARLENGYTVEQLIEAIDNYATILQSDKHFFSYKWPLEDFMKPKNVDNFLTQNNPHENYLKNEYKEGRTDGPKANKRNSNQHDEEYEKLRERLREFDRQS